MKPALKALTGLFFFLTASCGSYGHWENPKVARDQWPRDEASCNRKARAEINNEVARDPDYRDFGMDRGNTLKTNMLRYKTGKSQTSLATGCMSRLGYVKVGKKGWF